MKNVPKLLTAVVLTLSIFKLVKQKKQDKEKIEKLRQYHQI